MSGNVLYWLSNNLYVDRHGQFYRIEYRQVGMRTWVRDEPVRIEKGDIQRRGKDER